MITFIHLLLLTFFVFLILFVSKFSLLVKKSSFILQLEFFFISHEVTILLEIFTDKVEVAHKHQSDHYLKSPKHNYCPKKTLFLQGYCEHTKHNNLLENQC